MASLALVLSSCASLPDPPNGQMCSHYQALKIAICNDIRSGARVVPDTPIENTDKWVMFDLVTWQNIVNYMDALRRAAEKKGAITKEQSETAKGYINEYRP